MTEKVFDGGLMPGDVVSIGIDQSLTGFGMSAVSTKAPITHETWVYKSPYSGVARLDDIRLWIMSKLMYLSENGHTVHDVAMEGTVLASHSALKLGELSAVVKMTFWHAFEHGKSPRTPLQVPPMTLKKYATGKGNSKKQEMLMQIYKRWGIEFNDDNAADAYCLGRLATGYFESNAEKEALEKILLGDYRDSQ